MNVMTLAASSIVLISANVAGAQGNGYGPVNPGTTYTAVPPGFTPCANDYHTCNLSSYATKSTVVTVYYGAAGKYVASWGQGGFQCTPAGLGVPDPVPNVLKTCWVFATYYGSSDANPVGSPNEAAVSAVPASSTACAKDYGRCAATGTWFGFYGANGTFKNIAGSGSFTCVPGTFSITDPVPNVQKTCYVTPVVFGSFNMSVNPTLSVSGVNITYDLISGDGTQVGDVELKIAPGSTISNLSSISPMSLIATFSNIPSNYCITLYVRQYCHTPTISFQFPNNVSISSAIPINGVVGYTSTPPSGSSPGNIAQPVLSLN